MNSVDKIEGIMGMGRTVVNQMGGDWLGTTAHSDPNIPLDLEMGTGHLNASRASQQFSAGEQPPGGVQLKGWGYFFQDDPFIPNRYTLNLEAGDYVSATLVWDRQVVLNSPFPDYERGDEFTDLGFEDLDLFLVPAGGGPEQAVAASTSRVQNVEHLFASVPAAGSYEIWVTLLGFEFVEVPYALAWWAGADERDEPGDFNGDGNIDAADYVVWRKNDGTQAGYDEWVANFGSTSGSGSLARAAVPEPGA